MNSILIRKIKYFLKDYSSTLLTLGSIAVISILLMVSYRSYKQTLNDYELISQEVKLLKNRVDTLRSNKSLTENQITEYNQILSMLIRTLRLFSIIYAEISGMESDLMRGYTQN